MIEPFSKSASQAVKDFLFSQGIEPTDTNLDQFGLFMLAMRIFQERNKRYKDLWRDHTPVEHIGMARHKLSRVSLAATEDEFEDMDDAVDLINYICFYIRTGSQMQAGGTLAPQPADPVNPFGNSPLN